MQSVAAATYCRYLADKEIKSIQEFLGDLGRNSTTPL